MRAGEEPDVRSLRGSHTRDEKAGQGLGEEDGEDWYAGLGDVHGAWGIGLRHRVRWRNEGDGVMWLLKQSAGDVSLRGQIERGKLKGKQRDIDQILEETLLTV